MLLSNQIKKFINSLSDLYMYNGGLQFRNIENIIKLMRGQKAFYMHYNEILKTDIPFAQDYFGDQFFLRGNDVIKLYAETGDIEEYELDINSWFAKVEQNPEEVLNIDLEWSIEKGKLFLAYPPFCFKESSNAKISKISEDEVIDFHIDLHKKVKGIGDGETLKIELVE